jgi:hypothetical protein
MRHLIFMAAVLMIVALPLRAADVSGKWTATFTTDIGEQSYTYDFVVKGTALTGTAKGNLTGESKIADGKVDGDKVSFVENATFMDMPVRIVYTGQMTSADEIKMTRVVLDMITEQLVARRAK